jgi:hypothetical protein
MIATLVQAARHYGLLRNVRVAMSAARKAALPRLQWGNISMATACGAFRAAVFRLALDAVVARASASCRSALRRMRRSDKGPGALPAFATRVLSLCAMSCALALAGCASNSAQRESRPAPAVHVAAPAPVHRYSEPRIRRPDRALLTPQPVPDCEFRGSDDLKPMDPDQWARLKLDYERQCYQKAEQAVRDRLRLLQASSGCEIEPVRHSRRLIP